MNYSSDLPSGKMCKDCTNFERCRETLRAQHDFTQCYYQPHRFVEKQKVSSKESANVKP